MTRTAPADVHAVGFSGQMMGAVLLDGEFRPVRPALIWADHRSRDQCSELLTKVSMDEAYRITGHRLNPTYSLAKVMWVREHEPDAFARVRHVCLAKDFIVYRLTGSLVTDPSDASSTNAYDQTHGEWSGRLIAAAGIDASLFPPIVPSTTVVGGISKDAAAATGLPAGTPVVIGGGDGPLAAVGAGVVRPSDGAYVYLGSSSWVSTVGTRPLHDREMRTMTFNHVVPGAFVPTATMQAGGGSLAWLTDILVPGGDAESLAGVVDSAADVVAADDDLFFLPHLLGERSPYWNPAVRGAFVGLSRHHGPAHLARAVLEGVAFNLATCIDAFRDSGTVIDRIDAIGGGAVSDVWLSILADVWNVTVRRRTIVEEANSLGAAVTAGVGVSILSRFEVARTLSDVTAVFKPDIARHDEYRKRHRDFLRAYDRLEPWFEEVRSDGATQ
jgi:xylulokinase